MKILSALVTFFYTILQLNAQPPTFVDITDFGAVPNDGNDDTKAIQKAIDACYAAGAGTIVFPEGTWLSGTIYLKSNVNIYLSKGCTWQGIDDNDAYPFISPKVITREDKEARRAMIYAYQLENIKIFGEGVLYPGGDYATYASSKEDKKYYSRPFGIYMIACKNIIVEGIEMKNSPFWMQRYLNCDFLRLKDLTVYNHSNLNNDGIDIDGCHNVFVSNCLIDASDDALVHQQRFDRRFAAAQACRQCRCRPGRVQGVGAHGAQAGVGM